MNITLAIIKNRIKLERMIEREDDYQKILKQSKKLDKYINIAMKQINSIKKNRKAIKKSEKRYILKRLYRFFYNN